MIAQNFSIPGHEREIVTLQSHILKTDKAFGAFLNSKGVH